jgi:hypothetical protein
MAATEEQEERPLGETGRGTMTFAQRVRKDWSHSERTAW